MARLPVPPWQFQGFLLNFGGVTCMSHFSSFAGVREHRINHSMRACHSHLPTGAFLQLFLMKHIPITSRGGCGNHLFPNDYVGLYQQKLLNG